MKRLACFLAFVLTSGVLHAQNTFSYTAYVTLAPSTATAALSVQNPTGSTKQVYIKSVYAYCSVACTLTFKIRQTTGSTGNAVTPVAMQNSTPVSTARSNMTEAGSSGTTFAVLDFSGAGNATLPVNAVLGANQAFAVISSSITGTVRYTIYYDER